MYFHARTVVEEEEVEEAIREFGKKYPRLPDIWEYGWKWRLARNPELDGVLLEGTSDTFLLRTDPDFGPLGVPSMTILYRWNAEEVFVLSVRLRVP